MKKTLIKNEIVLPQQFRAAGVHAGIKKSGDPDMTLIVSDVPGTVAAGTFTTNQVRAAPVKVCMRRIKTGKGRAVIINSGNANACTGKDGELDAEAMAMAPRKRSASRRPVGMSAPPATLAPACRWIRYSAALKRYRNRFRATAA